MRKVARKVWKLLLFSQLYAPIKTGLSEEKSQLHVPTCQKVTRLRTELSGKKRKEKEKTNIIRKKKKKEKTLDG